MNKMEKLKVVHSALGAAMQIIKEATGEAPVAGAIVIQFNDPGEGFAGFAIAKLDQVTSLKIVDTMAMKFAAELRAAKVRLNTVKVVPEA